MTKPIFLCSVLFVLTALFSCGPCATTTCFKGGECVDGTCECPLGWEGDACDLATQTTLVGTYSVSSTCDNNQDVTTEWSVFVSNAGLTEIVINNFHETSFNVNVTINDVGSLEIVNQVITVGETYVFNGIGSFDGDGTINFEYTVAKDNETETCVVQALRM